MVGIIARKPKPSPATSDTHELPFWARKRPAGRLPTPIFRGVKCRAPQVVEKKVHDGWEDCGGDGKGELSPTARCMLVRRLADPDYVFISSDSDGEYEKDFS